MITTCIDLFTAPKAAIANPGNRGSFAIEFGEGISRITFFTDAPELASDLAEAVNAVLAKHRAAQPADSVIPLHAAE